jgi:hypothetical protein
MTQNWPRGNLKKWHFLLWTPYSYKCWSKAWLGNPFGIRGNSGIILIPDLLNSKSFIGILFSDCKMCSHQFRTRSLWFGILSCHRFFQFHESENIPTICIFLARQNDIYSYSSAGIPNNAELYGCRYNPWQSNLADNLTSTQSE